MKSKAVRIHGKNDLRLDEFELPPITDGEILAKVVSDSICMSSYKAAKQGPDHKRVPNDCDINPPIIGHEFCGEIIEVGKKWADKFQAGDKFVIQPAFSYKGSLEAPGYSYTYCGGDATYIIIPEEAMLTNSLLEYHSDTFFYGSLAEPMSCIVGAFHASYHIKPGTYVHDMGIIEGGNMAILAGVGPMGLGAIDYAIHCNRRPSLLIVTDIDDIRLARAQKIYTIKEAKKCGVDLHYINTRDPKTEAKIMELTDKKGFDDILVMAPVKPVVEQADRLLGKDGCLNFFAGPTNNQFSATFNFYNVHYAGTHVVGTSGGTSNDMIEAVDLMSKGIVNPTAMITHIGGMNAVIETTMHLPEIPGGKKLIYIDVDMPLTAIADFKKLGKTDEMFNELYEITSKSDGFWSPEAEKYLLNSFK